MLFAKRDEATILFFNNIYISITLYTIVARYFAHKIQFEILHQPECSNYTFDALIIIYLHTVLDILHSKL